MNGQQSATSEEIRMAGGLEKWMRKQADRKAVTPPRSVRTAATAPTSQAPAIKPAVQAKGRPPRDSAIGYDVERMNGLEAKYAGHLEAQRRAGAIVFWKFGEMKLRLADNTWYTTDFYILSPAGEIEIHETKGFMRDDANVKIKAAAEKYPEFKFVLVKWAKSGWSFKNYREHGGK